MGLTYNEALGRLKAGNAKYLSSTCNPGDVSPAIRRDTAANGQRPYAIIVACSDSREIPEAIFSCGIGELFTIRVAGNVIGDNQLGSIEYAAGHLEVPLAVVMGHTGCGAVDAAIEGHTEGHVGHITKDIIKAIAGEHDPFHASRRNVKYQVGKIRRHFPSLHTVGALYHIDSGAVEWLDF